MCHLGLALDFVNAAGFYALREKGRVLVDEDAHVIS
jgi:hypothetical protein